MSSFYSVTIRYHFDGQPAAADDVTRYSVNCDEDSDRRDTDVLAETIQKAVSRHWQFSDNAREVLANALEWHDEEYPPC